MTLFAKEKAGPVTNQFHGGTAMPCDLPEDQREPESCHTTSGGPKVP